MKNWSPYYTPEVIALDVLKKIPNDFVPNTAVDICVGSGNFLKAAKYRWPDINLIGVDQNISSVCLDIKNEIELLQQDAFDFITLNKKINRKFRGKKLMLANPPFGKLKKDYFFSDQNELDVMLNESLTLRRKEALMIFSNISLLEVDDYFAAVLPENIFSSSKFSTYKEILLDHFKNIWIGNVEHYFSGSEVKCRIFVGQFIGRSKKTKAPKNKRRKLNHENLLIRGIDNSKLLKLRNTLRNDDYEEVVHFSNSQEEDKLKRFIPKNHSVGKKRIENGDILIHRVGRKAGMIITPSENLIGKLISDYFFIFKIGTMSKRNMNLFQKELFLKKKGLTTCYITKSDILQAIDHLKISF